jgi:hypothetical protein
MPCALWSITDRCEKSLDRLEGYPDYYLKKEVSVKFENKTIKAMIYFMPSGNDVHFPSEHYFDTVVKGYKQHNMTLESILNALTDVTKESQNVYSMG